jgi:hypothetical protein
MTAFVESFATQQLLPPWESESAQTWGFAVKMSARRIADYLDAYFNGAYPDRAPFYYTPVPDAHYGLIGAVVFEKVASLNKLTATRLGDSGASWDHLRHTEVYLSFPALRYRRTPDNLLTGDPTLVWIEPFIFSDNDSVVFSSREIWGSDMYLAAIAREPGGPPHQLHLDLGMMGTKRFSPRSRSELLSVLHIRTGGDSPTGPAEILKARPELRTFVAILGGSGAFAQAMPDGVDPSPYAGGSELNNLKQFRDCFDMGAAIYRAIVASETTHVDVDGIVLFDAAKVEIDFMWSDSIGDLLRALLDVERPDASGPPPAHAAEAEVGAQSHPAPPYVGPPPNRFPAPPPTTPGDMDWDMARVSVPADFAFSFRSKVRFEVTGTIHTYGQTRSA